MNLTRTLINIFLISHSCRRTSHVPSSSKYSLMHLWLSTNSNGICFKEESRCEMKYFGWLSLKVWDDSVFEIFKIRDYERDTWRSELMDGNEIYIITRLNLLLMMNLTQWHFLVLSLPLLWFTWWCSNVITK